MVKPTKRALKIGALRVILSSTSCPPTTVLGVTVAEGTGGRIVSVAEPPAFTRVPVVKVIVTGWQGLSVWNRIWVLVCPARIWLVPSTKKTRLSPGGVKVRPMNSAPAIGALSVIVTVTSWVLKPITVLGLMVSEGMSGVTESEAVALEAPKPTVMVKVVGLATRKEPTLNVLVVVPAAMKMLP